MNVISIVGRLTRDPEARTTQNGKTFATFAVAVDNWGKSETGEKSATFFNVKAWSRDADYATSYLGKGRLVGVTGRIESRKYTDKDGNQREIWEITANSIQGLDRPRDDNDGGGAPSGGNYDRPAANLCDLRRQDASPPDDHWHLRQPLTEHRGLVSPFGGIERPIGSEGGRLGPR